ncbi:phosphate/phosphite/phosphonate ABC transporter substrate-binding protein [Methylobrevis albus]|uniref:PhnD/SsuA/transferrin family substrate-binding protein n=1 Tax=Methylobrevis albus TaxID=2793297 RepID=A0A931HXZ1_9HYPH|nr:PhnD/SsuA/transferrin family substrate-binding protein [Methylobrevis albus]MBH0236327.1 PhnD/SsuA/transferrin family substrate-binding protein [Methylobrevis albus]
MRIISLRMYADPPIVDAANDALWAAIAMRLAARGIDAPPELDRSGDFDAAWLAPDLLLAQTCGYPLVTRLGAEVQVVAAPIYGFPGGDGFYRASLIVVRSDEPAGEIAALRGRRVAANAPDSNSGTNLLRALVAPLNRAGRFFGAVTWTGSHAASLAAVRAGHADVAAVDSVTFGLFAAHAPERIAGLRVLAETPYGPGLPLITAAATPPRELGALRDALAEVAADRELAGVRATLGLTGMAFPDFADYEVLADHARAAAAAGYPELA